MADVRTEKRLLLLLAILACGWLALVVSLWYIQVVNGEKYEQLSLGNRTRTLRLAPPRGLIFDRNGEVVADNRPGFEVFVNLPEVTDRRKTARKLGALIGEEEEEMLRRMEAFRERPFEPVRVATDIGLPAAVEIEEQVPRLNGVEVQTNPLRHYPYGASLCHLLGYVGQISPRELERLEEEGYLPQDDIGKSGVEEVYDHFLQGSRGRSLLQVDARGYRDRELERRDPVPGNNLHLTLDLRSQLILEELMDSRPGAAVVLDPRNGDVLALVSNPGFDPNRMVRPVEQGYLSRLFANRSSPLVNRAIAGEYPPGSPFKLVVALAGLIRGAVDPREKIECNGVFYLGQGVFRCWKASGHGELDVEEAIKHSCNVYFYTVAVRLGLDPIRRMAMLLGLGTPTGIGLKGEKAGLLPSRQWKRKVVGDSWYPGDTVNLSIGQGYLLVTPLQMAVLGSVLANRGTGYVPRLASAITSPEGKMVEEYFPKKSIQTGFPAWIWDLVVRGMERVVNEPGGTAPAAAVAGIRVAGKTGTAQVGRPPDYAHDAWFVCFAPVDSPRVVLALILEGAGSGGATAAPVAGEFMRRYFGED